MNRFQKILMATDFSDASAPAWRRAVEMAAENGAELFVVNAFSPPHYLEAGPMSPRLYDECDKYLRAEVGSKLGLLINDAARSGVAAKPLVLVGNPEEAIVNAALENHVELIIMGTHGRKGVSRFFLGSVASRVIATAPCPVLTERADNVAPQRRPVEDRVMVGAIA
ncbi:MAG: universal stress protein [Acidobacteriota bacterium]